MGKHAAFVVEGGVFDGFVGGQNGFPRQAAGVADGLGDFVLGADSLANAVAAAVPKPITDV